MTKDAQTIEVFKAREETLRAEIERLAGMVTELERRCEAGGLAERILEAAPTLLYVYDIVEQRYFYANQRFSDFLGQPGLGGERMDRAELSAFVHPEDLPRIPEHYARLAGAEDGEVMIIEYRVRHRTGQWRWLLDRNVVFARTPDGAVQQILGWMQDISGHKQAQKELGVNQMLLHAFLDHTPALMLAKDLDGNIILANAEFDAFHGVERGSLLGKHARDLFPPQLAHEVTADDASVIAAGQSAQREQVIVRPDGHPHTYIMTKFPIHNAQGVIDALGVVSIDVTRAKQAEAERESLHAKMIEAQRATIRELTTPLLPLSQGVLAMPLVGTIDSIRAREILETLLQGVASQQATTVILDITAIKTVDTQVAQALVQAAQAAKLLGAQVVLTGIQPPIAQTLVDLGADLQGIVTKSTLQSGIAYAWGRSGPG